MYENLSTWELLSKQMIWKQLGSMHYYKNIAFFNHLLLTK